MKVKIQVLVQDLMISVIVAAWNGTPVGSVEIVAVDIYELNKTSDPNFKLYNIRIQEPSNNFIALVVI